MTNKLDALKQRTKRFGEGQEETVGVPLEGFSDASGEYPKRDYFFGSSINKSAKGETVNSLDLGGGDYGISLNVVDQKPSQYPYNQVSESPSGHVIEIDDTPGGERVLIKHRTGAGVEMRSDGTVIISSKNQRIEVTGGDHTTIVEGAGNLVYKGNLNLTVTGDYNVDVGGNYNLNVAGDKVEEIKGRHTKTVNRDQNYTIRGARGSQVIGMNTETLLGDHNVIVAGDMNNFVQGTAEILAGQNLITTAVKEWVAASSTANITARHISMIGHKGTIGGPLIDYYGKTYGGFPAAVTNLATFYGSLVGKSVESFRSDYSMFASTAGFSASAGSSLTAVTAASLGAGPPPVPVPPVPGIMPFIPIPPTAPIPNPLIVELQLSSSNYGIRNVSVDPKLKSKITKSDDYKNLFNHDPTIHEIRSKLRDRQHFNNGSFTSYLVSQGKLNSDFKKNIPFKEMRIGRSASKTGTIRLGVNLLGNNPTDNRSKRFKVNK
jgi:hypothetical protein